MAERTTPSANSVRIAHLVYALHAFSAVTGLASAALIVTAFLTGWPSIVAVIISHVKRRSVCGTWIDTHYRWQIRTFWFALLWVIVMAALFVTVIGIPLAWVVGLAVGLWVIYRIVRGWWRLVGNRPMPAPR